MNKLIYVAGAYHADTPKGILDNINRAEKISITLIRNGWAVFTPHKNTAGYEKYEDDTITVSTWLNMDLEILSRCDVLFIIDNYHKSKGTAIEIKYAMNNNIPIYWESDISAHLLKPLKF